MKPLSKYKSCAPQSESIAIDQFLACIGYRISKYLTIIKIIWFALDLSEVYVLH